MLNIQVEVTTESSTDVELQPIKDAVRATLQVADLAQATINVAIVGNDQIWDLNRKYLGHDYPTDVLSFRLNDDETPLEGDVIVNFEMAAEKAPSLGDEHWTAQRELVLYVIHGTLHLVGFDDATDQQRADMQQHERATLQRLGILHEAAFVGRSDWAEGETT